MKGRRRRGALKKKIAEDIRRDERLGGDKREFYHGLETSIEEILTDAIDTFHGWLGE